MIDYQWRDPMLKPGDRAPPFTAKDETGKDVKLEDFSGKRVVLWFYPKADTPGCTAEGCGFRDLEGEYAKKGATILGISYDTPADNAAFKARFAFRYALLSDPDARVAKAYGAFDESDPGYPLRNTYVIGPDGRVEHALAKVPARTHPKSLLDALG